MTRHVNSITPDNIIPNRDRVANKPLYLYMNTYQGQYGGGMIIIVAARNPMRAMELIHERAFEYDHADLEQIVGATYEGEEKVIKECNYIG